MLFVEAKQTRVGDATPVRRGIVEGLAYLDDAASIFRQIPVPHALVVAWNAGGSPGLGRVVVSDQEQIAAATDLIDCAWVS